MQNNEGSSLDVPLNPPSYASSTRSILDLHTQIRANASILNPKYNEERSSDDHLEVITAEMPANPTSSRKQPSSDTKDIAGSSRDLNRVRESGGGHYAVLVKRTNTKKVIKIILRSQIRPTVEDALEDLLRLTELELHSRLETCGRQVKDDECTIM